MSGFSGVLEGLQGDGRSWRFERRTFWLGAVTLTATRLACPVLHTGGGVGYMQSVAMSYTVTSHQLSVFICLVYPKSSTFS